MRVFLDTNIILDLLLEREGYEESAMLFQLQDEGKLSLAVSILTMVNVAYVYKKTVGQNMAIVNLKYLSSLVEVLSMNGEQLQRAIMTNGRDFEDIMQVMCAAEGGCEYLITRNSKDFKFRKGLSHQFPPPIVSTPSSFLDLFR